MPRMSQMKSEVRNSPINGDGGRGMRLRQAADAGQVTIGPVNLEDATASEPVEVLPGTLQAEEAGTDTELRVPDVHSDKDEGGEEEGAVKDETRTLQDVVFGVNCTDKVQRLLRAKADPNVKFHFADPSRKSKFAEPGGLTGFKKFFGTPVAASVMRNDVATVEVLVKAKADLEASFMFHAGLRRVQAEQTPIFAAVAKGHVECITKLLKLGARLDYVGKMDGEPNNTLLWHSCYFGSLMFVRYLLPRSLAHIDRPAKSQDEDDVSHTPLHIVAKHGNTAVAQALIAAGANIHLANELNDTPLTDAIDHDHPDVVRLLVSKTADVLSEDPMNKLFNRKNNMVTITAAAEGLRMACKPSESYLKENLYMEHVVKFLNTPGDAAMHIIHIAFMCRHLRYYENKKRKVHTTAHIPNNRFNVTIGPDADVLPEWNVGGSSFSCTRASDGKAYPMAMMEKAEAFYCELLPGNRVDLVKKMPTDMPIQVPIDVFQCIVKGIHRNVDVLHAIAESSNNGIFNEMGCQAVVELGWRRIRPFYIASLAVNSFFAVLMFELVSVLNGARVAAKGEAWDTIRKVLLLACWVFNLAREILQFIGYIRMGKVSFYLRVSNFVDLVRLAMTGATVLMILIDVSQFEGYGSSSSGPRLLLAFVCFFRWMKVLNGLNGFEIFGPSMLPIQTGVGEMWTFTAVVMFPLVGFSHAYYALGIYKDDLIRVVDIIYRLGFIGEHDLLEMENVEEDERGSLWRVWVRLLLLAVSFFVGLTMMNIFIAVVGEAYMVASQDKMLIFWRNKASIVLDESAVLAALLYWRRCTGEGAASPVSIHNSETADGLSLDYVWFCRPKEEAMHAGDGAIDDLDSEMKAPATVQDLEDVKGRIRSIEKSVAKIAEALASGGAIKRDGHNAEAPDIHRNATFNPTFSSNRLSPECSVQFAPFSRSHSLLDSNLELPSQGKEIEKLRERAKNVMLRASKSLEVQPGTSSAAALGTVAEVPQEGQEAQEMQESSAPSPGILKEVPPQGQEPSADAATAETQPVGEAQTHNHVLHLLGMVVDSKGPPP